MNAKSKLSEIIGLDEVIVPILAKSETKRQEIAERLEKLGESSFRNVFRFDSSRIGLTYSINI